MSRSGTQAGLDRYSGDTRDLLDVAFENGGESSVRGEYVEQPSRAFSQWHRTLPKWYTVIDIDWAYYYNDSRETYLLCETITVPENSLSDGVVEKYPINSHKRDVLDHLSDAINVPSAAIWHSESCDRFFVKRIDSGSGVRELVGDSGYADWIDEFRLGDSP